MTDTSGVIALRIARLERQLIIVEQQLAMSERYPEYKQKLTQVQRELQLQLETLIRQQPVLMLKGIHPGIEICLPAP